VQRVPDLLYAIKEAVYDNPTPGRFLLTGSANIFTAPKISESLAGRVSRIELWALAQSETGQRDICWSTITRLLRALGGTVAELTSEVEREGKPEDPADPAWRAGRR
jgi:predicted AAA+ superfamily ATPase